VRERPFWKGLGINTYLQESNLNTSLTTAVFNRGSKLPIRPKVKIYLKKQLNQCWRFFLKQPVTKWMKNGLRGVQRFRLLRIE
jgi:hypothetical protein